MSGDVIEDAAGTRAVPGTANARTWRWLNVCVVLTALITAAGASGAGAHLTLGFVLAPVWFLLGLVWSFLALAWLASPGRLSHLLFAPVVVLCLALAIAVGAPVRARFELSRSAIDQLASSPPPSTGAYDGFEVHHRVGLFLISRGYDGPARWSDGPRCLDLAESHRFALGAPGRLVRVPAGATLGSCGYGDGIDLGGGWYAVGLDD